MLKFIVLATTVTACFAASSGAVRPCLLNDLQCIQDNLAANSNCKRNVAGYIPSEYVIPEYRFETPYFNASYIDKNLIVRDHDKCVVSEFYINTATDKAVLSLDCINLRFESDRTMLQHRSLLEDAVFGYHIDGTYPALRFTVTMNRADKIDFCNEFTYTEVLELPVFNIAANDKPTENYLTRDLTDLFIYERETFAFRGQEVMGKFVNELICNFGC